MKKITKLIASALVLAYIIVFIFFIYPTLGKSQDNGQQPNTKILQLWHIDMFEGGSGSREDFLRQQAIAFEKANKGIYIIASSVSKEQLISSLEQGKKPDIISYAPGIANTLLPVLASFEGTLSAYSNMIDSGIIENKLFGVPWCSGGYIVAGVAEHLNESSQDFIKVLASSAKQLKKGMLYSFNVGYSQHNNPLLAAIVANNELILSENSLRKDGIYTQSEAYNRFVSKNDSTFLLGTQRDAVRLSLRENSVDFVMEALPGFTDLVCYISIVGDSTKKIEATKYIEYLLSKEVQRKLVNINMFSTTQEGLYSEGVMADIEKNIKNNTVLNAFIEPEILQNNRELAMKAINGDKDCLKKIWKLLP